MLGAFILPRLWAHAGAARAPILLGPHFLPPPLKPAQEAKRLLVGP